MKKTTAGQMPNAALTDIDISEMMIVAIEAHRAGFPKIQGNPEHIVELGRLARIGLQHENGLSVEEAEARATAHYEDVLALRKQLAEKFKLVRVLAEALEFYRDTFVPYKQHKHLTGFAWKPSEALLEDCGEKAIEALGKINPADLV